MWSRPLSFNLIQPPSFSAPSNNSELPMNCTTIVVDQRVTRHVWIRLSRICSRLYIREHNTRWYRISTRVCCVWSYLNREWLSSTTYVYSFAFIHVYSRLFAFIRVYSLTEIRNTSKLYHFCVPSSSLELCRFSSFHRSIHLSLFSRKVFLLWLVNKYWQC